MENVSSSILQCASSGTKWDSALDEICEVFGAKTAALQGADYDHVRRDLLGLGRFFREDAPELPALYAKGDDVGDEKAFELLSSLPPNEFVTEYGLYGLNKRSELPESSFRTMVAGRGLLCRTMAVLNPNGPWFDVLVLFFDSDDGEQALLQSREAGFVMRLMSQTMALQRVLNSLRERFSAALTVLDHLGLGVFLVNSNREVLLSNREGDRLLEEGSALRLNHHRKLCSLDNYADGQLGKMVEDVVGTADGTRLSSGGRIAIKRSNDLFDLLVSVAPLRDSESELEPDLRCAFVLAIDPARSGVLDATGIALIGNLTPAETEVANSLVSGLRLKEIAEYRDTSPETVRDQVKAISSKLRCSSQSDIIRLAAATRLPIGDNSK